MKISIKRNDAFRVLSDATTIGISELEEKMLNSMIEEKLIEDDIEFCGLSVWQVANDNQMTVPELCELFFPGQTNNEIPQLLDRVYIWGEANEHQCDECGCEMKGEEDSHGDHSWTNWVCENPNCKNKLTEEPDWDTMPGGHDYF